jgi:hypothetical protein
MRSGDAMATGGRPASMPTSGNITYSAIRITQLPVALVPHGDRRDDAALAP